MVLRRLDVGRIAIGGHLGEQAQRPRLEASLAALAGKRQSSATAGKGVLKAAVEQVHLAHMRDEERMVASDPQSLH